MKKIGWFLFWGNVFFMVANTVAGNLGQAIVNGLVACIVLLTIENQPDDV